MSVAGEIRDGDSRTVSLGLATVLKCETKDIAGTNEDIGFALETVATLKPLGD